MTGREHEHEKENKEPCVPVARDVSVKVRGFDSLLRVEIKVETYQSGAVRTRDYGCDNAEEKRSPTRGAVTQQIRICLQKSGWD